MNRYKTIPGLGPQRATATTTCQKCLKKGHYSYECKATLQDRPYASRPSRTQQFNDPKLAPKLTSTKPNELLETNGVADKILAEAEAKRNRENRQASPSPLRSPSPVIRRRSRSVSSVSTISTNRSPSPSPTRRGRAPKLERTAERRRSESVSGRRVRKRRHDSLSSASTSSRSPSPRRRSRLKTRRHRLDSPDSRGRPVPRRGSHRSPTRSLSLDKSRVTRARRSLESRDEDSRSHQRKEDLRPPREDVRSRGQPRNDRRSLSPYSRRLALTQAMNMG